MSRASQMNSFDQIALLDMLWSFAHVSISRPSFFFLYISMTIFFPPKVRNYSLSIIVVRFL